jgi:tRNA pseudouridine55 synthase
LRRTRVGPFSEGDAVTLDELARLLEVGGDTALMTTLKPVATGVEALPAVNVSRGDAQRLVLGQSVLLRGRDAPMISGLVSVSTGGALVALAEMEQGALKPKRIFNLPR